MSYAERRNAKLTGRWYADVEHKDTAGLTTRYRKAFATKGEAEGFEAYVRATGAPPPHTVETPVGSFADIAKSFLARTPDWAKRDPTAKQRLDYAVTSFLGPMDIKQINTQQLDKYVDKLQACLGRAGLPPANRTINNYLNAVSKVLRFAHQRGMVAGMPHVPRVANKGKQRAAVPESVEASVCSWLEEKGRGDVAFVVRLLAGTGMRKGELYKLTPEQIETDGFCLKEEQTKTNQARWVSIPEHTARELRARLANGSIPKPSQVYDMFKRALKARGADTTLTIHGLRHATVTRLLAAGENPLQVAEIVGHSSLATTKIYNHPDKATIAKAAKKVQNFGGEIKKTGEIVEFNPNEKRAESA